MKKKIIEAYEHLITLEIKEELKEGLKSAFEVVMQSNELIEQSDELYKRLFESDKLIERADIACAADADVKELYTVVAFTRAVIVDIRKLYDIPDPQKGAVYNVLRHVAMNYEKLGHCVLAGESLFYACTFAYPLLFQLGRMAFQIEKFTFDYEVYKTDSGIVELVTDDIVVDGDRVTGSRYLPDRLAKGEKETFAGAECVLKKGDLVISCHFPGTDKLSDESIEESFSLAEKFFAKYFPTMKFNAYICSSWLLDTGLERFLSESSNILKLQKRFTIPYRVNNTFSLFHDVFHRRTECPLDELVPTNRFQREVLEDAKNGGKLYSGRGYILI